MKLKWMALLILVLILSACGHDCSVTEPVLTSLQQTEQTADSVKETTAESTTDMGMTIETEKTDETNDSQTTEAKTMEDVIHIDPAEYSWCDGCYTLLDQDNCLIEMVFSKSISSDNTFIAYIVQNRTDQDYTVKIEDVLLNDTVQTNDKPWISVPAGSQKMSETYKLDNSCFWIGYDNIRKLSAKVEIELQDWTVLDSVNCVIDFPEGIPLHFAYGPFRSMRADRQVLLSNESMTLALLGCGKFYAESGEYRMTGYLWADNTGNMEIPISISNVSVNGMVVKSSNGLGRVLQPGNSCVMEFSVNNSDLDIAEIQSIESVQLQILTSAEENSAEIGYLTGGIWYPLALAVSGKAIEAEGGQEVIYDDGLLEIRFDHVNVESWSDDTVELSYYVLVSNRRAEGIYLEVVDPFVDGMPYQSHDGYVSVSNNGLGPESKGMMEIIAYIPKTEEEAIPELSFLLRVRSQGGDSIFYTTSERIVLTGK